MINLLKSEEIENLDAYQLKVIDFVEKRYETVFALSILTNKKYNPIELIVQEGNFYQVFMSCKGKQGATYLCSFNDLKTFNPELIKSKANEKMKNFSLLDYEKYFV